MTPAHRIPVPAPPARIDHVRGFARTYEVTAWGSTVSTNPMAGWARGEIIRATAPRFALPPPTPMYDPTIIGQPAAWNR